jgi:hypothetical protein
MIEIYFINDYFVRTTSWKLAFISWLNHNGDLTDVLNKAILAMDTIEEMIELMGAFTSEEVDYYGIAKEISTPNKFITIHEELEKAE